MFNWNSLLDESELTSVLPGKYGRFAQPVRDGLLVFLNGLPVAHQEEILAQQALLPSPASISQRLSCLARCCPVLHKLGQILARDPRLAPQLRRQLRKLESFAPTVPEEMIQKIVTHELGPLERLGIRLTLPALAEASVAVVVPFEFVDADSGNPRKPSVFKVLKPGIEERLGLELELLERVGSHLDERCEALHIPPLDYEESFQQIREKLRHEVRLTEEQRHLVRAAHYYANEPRVHIPDLLDYCTPRITAMERITGGKVTDHRFTTRHERSWLAEVVVRALIAHPIFSRADRALFHGDPHAGNLFLTDENRLGILDWSLVGVLRDWQRVAMMQILLAAMTLDAKRIVVILKTLNEGRRLDLSALRAAVEISLKRIRQGMLPGMTWLVGLLDDAMQTARLRVDADLVLFRKSLHALEGVVADIHTDGAIDAVLSFEFMHHFASEWTRRCVALPDSRAFATHLSNFDLARAWLNGPAAVARLWMGHGRDRLADCWTASDSHQCSQYQNA